MIHASVAFVEIPIDCASTASPAPLRATLTRLASA